MSAAQNGTHTRHGGARSEPARRRAQLYSDRPVQRGAQLGGGLPCPGRRRSAISSNTNGWRRRTVFVETTTARRERHTGRAAAPTAVSCAGESRRTHVRHSRRRHPPAASVARHQPQTPRRRLFCGVFAGVCRSIGSDRWDSLRGVARGSLSVDRDHELMVVRCSLTLLSHSRVDQLRPAKCPRSVPRTQSAPVSVTADTSGAALRAIRVHCSRVDMLMYPAPEPRSQGHTRPPVSTDRRLADTAPRQRTGQRYYADDRKKAWRDEYQSQERGACCVMPV